MIGVHLARVLGRGNTSPAFIHDSRKLRVDSYGPTVGPWELPRACVGSNSTPLPLGRYPALALPLARLLPVETSLNKHTILLQRTTQYSCKHAHHTIAHTHSARRPKRMRFRATARNELGRLYHYRSPPGHADVSHPRNKWGGLSRCLSHETALLPHV